MARRPKNPNDIKLIKYNIAKAKRLSRRKLYAKYMTLIEKMDIDEIINLINKTDKYYAEKIDDKHLMLYYKKHPLISKDNKYIKINSFYISNARNLIKFITDFKKYINEEVLYEKNNKSKKTII